MDSMNNDFNMQSANKMSDEEFAQLMTSYLQQDQPQSPFNPGYDGNTCLPVPAAAVEPFPGYQQGQSFNPQLPQNPGSVGFHPYGNDEYTEEARWNDKGNFYDASLFGTGSNQQEQYIDPRPLQNIGSVGIHPEEDSEYIGEAKKDEEGNQNDASSDLDSLFGEKEVEGNLPSPDFYLLGEQQAPPVPASAFPIALPSFTLALPSLPLPCNGPENNQQIVGDASQRTVEAGHMAYSLLQSPSPAEPVSRASPALENIVDKAIKPNNKGKRVTKNNSNKKAREVKANSCEACRRSKTKCVREGDADGCNYCKKKNRVCHVSGTDGRTNKTNQERLDAAVTAVNDYLKDAVLLCSELVDHPEQRQTAQALLHNMGDLRQVRAIISGLTRSPLKEFRFAMGPFRPPFYEGATKLAETRNQRIPQLKEAAMKQAEIVGSLLIMIVFSGQSQLEEATTLVARVMLHNIALNLLKNDVQQHCYFPPGSVHPVCQQIRQEIEDRISAALA
ncbi:uncharacterized protein ColSpa_07331 [Colletotrichum spaethianum]|uniref:Zn(2)-C6 fungal-type domain-containing protein n=1 Tax=Colletotrichum spaethianum TaxID=700344 RepID=A0AA37P1S7_9PEZI|nr:uncharacterized protein ColSpa_07331 [Colletotrichum spaethianum]GKT47150.1 hypothetical protein ColSpa_07331 [Colletotrichum spaethianum]